MAEEGKDLPSLTNTHWWELYRDAELQKLIRVALEQNKDLKRAIATVDELAAWCFGGLYGTRQRGY